MRGMKIDRRAAVLAGVAGVLVLLLGLVAVERLISATAGDVDESLSTIVTVLWWAVASPVLVMSTAGAAAQAYGMARRNTVQ